MKLPNFVSLYLATLWIVILILHHQHLGRSHLSLSPHLGSHIGNETRFHQLLFPGPLEGPPPHFIVDRSYHGRPISFEYTTVDDLHLPRSAVDPFSSHDFQLSCKSCCYPSPNHAFKASKRPYSFIWRSLVWFRNQLPDGQKIVNLRFAFSCLASRRLVAHCCSMLSSRSFIFRSSFQASSKRFFTHRSFLIMHACYFMCTDVLLFHQFHSANCLAGELLPAVFRHKLFLFGNDYHVTAPSFYVCLGGGSGKPSINFEYNDLLSFEVPRLDRLPQLTFHPDDRFRWLGLRGYQLLCFSVSRLIFFLGLGDDQEIAAFKLPCLGLL